MPEYAFLRAAPVNLQKLETEIETAVSVTDGFHTKTAGEILVISPVVLTQAQIDTLATVIANHDPNIQTDGQQTEAARQIALQAKTYIRDQLIAGNTNIGQIFTQMKTFIDDNPRLLTMQNTEIQLKSLAYGWNAASVTGATAGSTNIIKAQYIEAAMSIVGAVG